MTYFAKNLWKKLWDSISRVIADTCDVDNECNAEARLSALDRSGNGIVSVDEIQQHFETNWFCLLIKENRHLLSSSTRTEK
jgi:hypothetical protein